MAQFWKASPMSQNKIIANCVRRPLLGALMIALIASCALNAAEDHWKSPSPEEIVKGANETYMSFIKATNAKGPLASAEISKEYWSAEIRAHKPLKVYTHMVNLVVVQKSADRKEEGLYIYIQVSSYLPMDGVDGFKLTPKPNQGRIYTLGDGIFRYERKRD
jgi:hypothetical protein